MNYKTQAKILICIYFIGSLLIAFSFNLRINETLKGILLIGWIVLVTGILLYIQKKSNNFKD